MILDFMSRQFFMSSILDISHHLRRRFRHVVLHLCCKVDEFLYVVPAVLKVFLRLAKVLFVAADNLRV